MVHDVTSIRFGKELNADKLLTIQVMSIDVEMDIILSISNLGIVEELIDDIELEVIEGITGLIKEKSLDEYIKEIDIGDTEIENILYDYCEDMIQRHHELGLEIGYGLLPHVAPIKVKLNGKYEHFLELYDALHLFARGEGRLGKDFKLLIKVIESLPLFDKVKEIREVEV